MSALDRQIHVYMHFPGIGDKPVSSMCVGGEGGFAKELREQFSYSPNLLQCLIVGYFLMHHGVLVCWTT